MEQQLPLALGDQLNQLIGALRQSRHLGVAVGPTEAISAHQLILALAFHGISPTSRGPQPNLAAYRDHLAPVFAKTREQREIFFRAFDETFLPKAKAPELNHGSEHNRSSESTRDTELEPKQSWLTKCKLAAKAFWKQYPVLTIVIATLLLGAGAYWKFRPVPDIVPETQGKKGTSGRPRQEVGENSQLPPSPQTARTTDPMQRLLRSASRHDGAPTLAEIAHDLSLTASVPMVDEEYLRRLRDLTGMQPYRPLPITFGDDFQPQSASKQRDYRSEVAWAIGEIEIPGRNRSFAEIAGSARLSNLDEQMAFNAMVSVLDDSDQKTSDKSDAQLAMAMRGAVESMANGRGQVTAEIAAWNRANVYLDSLSDNAILRAIAIIRPEWTPKEANWLPQQVKRPTTPPWVAYLIALMTFALFALSLRALFDKRRAFLRNQPPLIAPHRTRLIRDANETMLGPRDHFAEIRKALQRREPIVTRTLDVDGTVRASIAEASGRIVPRFAAMRSAPEYLVLIDRRSVNDLEAERAWKLIEPLRAGVVGFDIYWFHTDPGLCTPESGVGAVRIEELGARFPHHRLLLMSKGVDMIDLFNGRARGGFASLDHWARRGMLTPVAVDDWAREEWLIARAFKGPLGRATSGGLMALAQRLLTDMSGRAVLPIPDGDDDAPPLPDILLTDPHRFMDENPPQASGCDGALDPVDELIIELGWYPDRACFVWLCALAVYPAVTFDLALYLGQSLLERAGDETSPPLLTPRRLAALTQLPWLREGHIPIWLRRRLISELSPGRAAEIRKLIIGLIDKAGDGNDVVNPSHAQYGREDRKLGPGAGKLYDDEVLVTFLLEGEATDFEINRPKDRVTAWGRIKNADWLMVSTVLLVLAYVLGVWWITPKPEDGRLVTGLGLPTLGLLVMAALCAVWLRPRPVAWGLRKLVASMRIGAFFVMFFACASPLVDLTNTYLLPLVPDIGWLPPRAWMWIGLVVLLHIILNALFVLAALYSKVETEPVVTTSRWLWLAGIFAIIRYSLHWPIPLLLVLIARADGTYGAWWLTALGLAGFGLLWFAPRTKPGPYKSFVEIQAAANDRRPAVRRALPFVGWLLLLGLALGYGWGVKNGRVVLAEPNGYVPVVATSPDGLVAITQPGGRSVRVFQTSRSGAMASPRKIVAEYELNDPKDFPTVEIVRLAVERAPKTASQDGQPILLVAALSSGAVIVYDNAKDPRVLMDTSSSTEPSDYTVPGSIRLSISPTGYATISKVTSRGMLEITMTKLRLTADDGESSRSLRTKAPRITSIEWLSADMVVFGTADGKMWIWYGDPTLNRERFPINPGVAYQIAPEPSLPAGPRLIRRIENERKDVIAAYAVADDGTAVVVAMGASGKLVSRSVGPFFQLAVGPIIPWQQQTRLRTAESPKSAFPTNGAQKRREPIEPIGEIPPIPCEDFYCGRTIEVALKSTADPEADSFRLRDLAELIEDLGSEYGIIGYGVSNHRLAAFLAVSSYETGGFQTFSENLSYNSPQRLMQVFGPRQFPTLEIAIPYVNNPEKLANRVYANRSGNGDELSGDGWKYRGRGLFMSVGRYFYVRYVENGLVNPDQLATNVNIMLRASMKYWRDNGMNELADRGDLAGLRRQLSGSTPGTNEIAARYQKIIKILDEADTPNPAAEDR